MTKRSSMSLRHALGMTALIASLSGAMPDTAHAIPSVSTAPATDVYAILAQNPGLQASLPFYNAPQVTGQFTSLTVIGDSYGDQGNALRDNPVSSQVGADGRYGNALNIIDALQYHYALPTSSITNYAFGGATTGTLNNNPPALMLPGFSQELDALVASGRRFSSSDLITFTTAGVGGGNDTPLGISVAQGTANIVGYVNTLIGLGARNIVLNAPTTAALQAALTPFASQGVNIYLFDQGALVSSILANPTAYGFSASATSLDYCSRLGGPNVCNEGGINKARLQTTSEILAEDQYLFFFAHPTTALAAQIAAGDAALIASGATLPEPGTIGLLASALVAAVGSISLRRKMVAPSRA